MYIDSHVHLRDFKQKHKETIFHGLKVASDSDVDAVFDMPNSDPPITTREVVIDRLKLASQVDASDVFYGVYMGLTADPEQIKRAVDVQREFLHVVGFKLYAGHSVGTLGVVSKEDQHMVYHTLAQEGYDGVLAVHCEKESQLHPHLWNHKEPITHCYARPEEAEVESINDQLQLSLDAKFKGKLHIAHISSPRAVDALIHAKSVGRDVSSGICPHHFIYDWSQMCTKEGLLWKMNPPLRQPESRNELFDYLKTGKIDWIETDHAPHSLEEKINNPFMSGIPGLAWWPLFAEYLRKHEFSNDLIHRLTFSNIVNRFELDIDCKDRLIRDRRGDYAFDPYVHMAQEIGW